MTQPLLGLLRSKNYADAGDVLKVMMAQKLDKAIEIRQHEIAADYSKDETQETA